MDRMHSLEKLTEMIKNSDSTTEKEKSDYIETYKKNYYSWLDELKQKLKNYKPLFADWRMDSSSFNYSEHNLQGEIWKKINQAGYSRYEISNLGRVKYLGCIVPQKNELIDGREHIGYLVLDKLAFQKKISMCPKRVFSKNLCIHSCRTCFFRKNRR